MAGAKTPTTPFQKLAEALEGSAPTGSQSDGSTETFKVDRGAATIEVSLAHGASPCLVLRAHEEEAAPSSALKKNVLLRARARLVYPGLLVRRVTSLDRVNTLLALRFEVRTGDRAFDGAVTIETDLSDDVIAQTFGAAEARAAILEILGAGFMVQLEERSVRAELLAPTYAHFTAPAITPAIDALAALVAHVPRVDPAAFTKRPQAGRGLAGVILLTGLVATAALAPGTLDEPGIPMRDVPRPLLPMPAMLPGVLLGSGLFVIAYLVLRWLLKRRNVSTDLPLVLALFVVLATLGVGALDGGNWLLDDAPLAVHDAVLVGKDAGKSRKSGALNEWVLVVVPWHPRASAIELGVSSDLYESVRPGDMVRVTVHPGFFEWEWGAVVERAPAEAPPAVPDPRGSRPE